MTHIFIFLFYILKFLKNKLDKLLQSIGQNFHWSHRAKFHFDVREQAPQSVEKYNRKKRRGRSEKRGGFGGGRWFREMVIATM